MASKEFHALLAQLKNASFSTDLHEARQAYEGMGLQFPVSDDIVVEVAQVGGRPAEFLSPAGQAVDSVILYLHGGGYSLGSCNTHRHVAAEIARQAGARVCVLDYRLAPEHTMPAALDDAIAACAELLKKYPAQKVALAGDSAGGSLVVATLAHLAAAGLPMPAASYCMSPWADLRCNSETSRVNAGKDPLGNPELARLMADRYLAGADPLDPRVTPSMANLAGLSPVMIQVGTAEILLDDSFGLARALAIAGVGVELDVWPEMVHLWQCFYPVLPEGRDALRKGCLFLRRYLDGGADARA